MTALIRKDLYMLGKQTLVLLAIALLLSLASPLGNFGSVYMIALTMTLPLTTLAYDERCHWDQYMAMTPCPPGRIVASKYLFTLLLSLTALVLTFALDILKRCVLGQSYDQAESLISRLCLLLVILFVNALSIPAVYRFGAEKGRLLMMFLFFAVFGVIVGGVALVGDAEKFRWVEERLSPLALGAGAAVFDLVLNVLSCRLSVHFYRKRRAGEYG